MFPANLVEATFKQVSRARLQRGGAGGEERPGYGEEREEGKRGRAIPEVTGLQPSCLTQVDARGRGYG